MSCTSELLFLQLSRFLSLYFSITYAFSTGLNSSPPPRLHQLKVSVIRRLRPILVRPCSKYFSIASHYWRRGNWNNLHYLFTSASLLISANAVEVGVKYANFPAGDPSSTHEINEMSSTVARNGHPDVCGAGRYQDFTLSLLMRLFHYASHSEQVRPGNAGQA